MTRPLPLKTPNALEGWKPKNSGMWLDPLVLKVIEEEADYQSRQLGRRISKESVVVNLAFYPNQYTRLMSARMREALKELERNERDGKAKYINRPPSRAYQRAQRKKLGGTAEG